MGLNTRMTTYIICYMFSNVFFLKINLDVSGFFWEVREFKISLRKRNWKTVIQYICICFCFICSWLFLVVAGTFFRFQTHISAGDPQVLLSTQNSANWKTLPQVGRYYQDDFGTKVIVTYYSWISWSCKFVAAFLRGTCLITLLGTNI